MTTKFGRFSHQPSVLSEAPFTQEAGARADLRANFHTNPLMLLVNAPFGNHQVFSWEPSHPPKKTNGCKQKYEVPHNFCLPKWGKQFAFFFSQECGVQRSDLHHRPQAGEVCGSSETLRWLLLLDSKWNSNRQSRMVQLHNCKQRNLECRTHWNSNHPKLRSHLQSWWWQQRWKVLVASNRYSFTPLFRHFCLK